MFHQTPFCCLTINEKVTVYSTAFVKEMGENSGTAVKLNL